MIDLFFIIIKNHEYYFFKKRQNYLIIEFSRHSFCIKDISCNSLKLIFFFKFLSKSQKCNSIISKYIKPGIIKKMLTKK